MKLLFRKAKLSEIDTALLILKQAASFLQSKKVNQWDFWLQPPKDKINWVKEGFKNGEFYFVENESTQLIGMFRLLTKDELYWGEQESDAYYVHSLVVKQEFTGMQYGSKILAKIESELIKKGVLKLRLDCNASNPVLCAYYEEKGFVKVGQKKMPHSLNYLYEKELNQIIY